MSTTAEWVSGELLGFDLETTGVDRFTDVPVSFALVTMREGQITERVCGLIDPGRDIPEGATAVHGITTERARRWGRPLGDAVSLVMDALLAASKREVPVVGMKIDFDLTMIDVQARRLCGEGFLDHAWQGPVLDGLVLDRHFDTYRKGRRTLVDLCEHYGVAIAHAHDAGSDAEAIIRVLRAMTLMYPDLALLAPADLHRAQIGWHRAWAESYDRWRRDQLQPELDPRDFDWPYSCVGRGRNWWVA
jgi:DNA polymerase-3 subunit epsilon